MGKEGSSDGKGRQNILGRGYSMFRDMGSRKTCHAWGTGSSSSV